MVENSGDISLDTVCLTRSGSYATLWLKREDKRNAINVQMLSDLNTLLDRIEDSGDELEPVLLIRGFAGHFSKGIDLQDFPKNTAPDIHGFNKWERIVRRVERLERATIAVIEGDCLGGGLQLALACDFRVVVESASMAFPEVKQGFLPGLATFRLSKYVGLGHAKRLILTGGNISPEWAQNLGLITSLVSADQLDEAISQLIDALSPVQRIPLSLARRLLNESYEFSWEDTVGHFLAAQHRAITDDAFAANAAAKNSESD